jgi:hypothetical protein
MDIHTAEPLIAEPNFVEVEIVFGKLKGYKSLVLIRFWQNLSNKGMKNYIMR